MTIIAVAASYGFECECECECEWADDDREDAEDVRRGEWTGLRLVVGIEADGTPELFCPTKTGLGVVYGNSPGLGSGPFSPSFIASSLSRLM